MWRRRKEAASRIASNSTEFRLLLLLGDRYRSRDRTSEETGKARSGGEAVENRRVGGASGQRPPRSLLPSRDKHARHSRKRGAIEPLALISRLRDRFRPVFYLVQWIGSVYRSAILRLGWVN